MARLIVDKIGRARGYNQGTLQIDARLAYSIVSRYWHNKVRSVSLDALESLAHALNCSVADLFSDAPAGAAPSPEDIARIRLAHPDLADALCTQAEAAAERTSKP